MPSQSTIHKHYTPKSDQRKLLGKYLYMFTKLQNYVLEYSL